MDSEAARPDAMPVPAPRKRHPALTAAIVLGTCLLVLAAISIQALLAQGIKLWLVQPFIVPSSSNIPTVVPGDRILVAKQFSVRRGDLIVMHSPPPQSPALLVIRRIVATGGDVVDIKDGKLWLNGSPLDEPYTAGKPTLPGTVAVPLTVPQGFLFVLGDNRPDSGDSRFYGPVPVGSVVGRVFAIYWPPSRARRL